jgi:glutaredoxin
VTPEERTRVTMYSRTTCGLCDEAREVILAVRAENPFEYEEVLVDGKADLEGRYGERVPVVLVNGEEEFDLHVDPERLRGVLATAGD